MKAMKSTWKTLNDCLGVVHRSHSYSLYPLLSSIILLLATFAVLVPLFESLLGADQSDVLARVYLFLAVYLVQFQARL